LVGDGETWTFETFTLTAMAYIFGAPPGRHARTNGPRGLVPAVRDWLNPS